MPYCSECGNEVSKTDVRCGKCGHKLEDEIIDPPVGPEPPIVNPPKWNYHNIEFALAIISVVLSVFALSQSISYYPIEESGVFLFLISPIFIGIIGAVIIRYFAKPGAIILLIAGFMLVIFGIENMILPMIFYIATAVVAFYLN